MSEISQTERVSDEELDQMIWKLERDGMTPKMLSLMRELREVRRNYPVIPDGWVMVPEELTCEMDDAAWQAYHETRSMSDIWEALLAAAPKEVNK